MTRAFAVGLLLLGQMLLQPALAIGKPRPRPSRTAKKPAKVAKKSTAPPAPLAPVAQAVDDETPGSRQEKAPKKK